MAHLDQDAIYGPKRATGAYPRYGRLFTAAQALLHRVGIPAASGSNMAVRRDVFARVGGFRLDLPVNEDTELMMRIHYRGFRVRWAPALVVVSLDDRRLRQGLAYKSAHNLARGCCSGSASGCACRPAWLASDWGYWSRSRPAATRASGPDSSSRAPRRRRGHQGRLHRRTQLALERRPTACQLSRSALSRARWPSRAREVHRRPARPPA